MIENGDGVDPQSPLWRDYFLDEMGDLAAEILQGGGLGSSSYELITID